MHKLDIDIPYISKLSQKQKGSNEWRYVIEVVVQADCDCQVD